VVACFDVACGKCWFCKHEFYSLCDATNDSKDEKDLYGDRTAGFYGYSKVTGQWPGGQAQYARVPFGGSMPFAPPSLLFLAGPNVAV
jgi:threonine dehydrogenase-like Zn-dependent dehydrogenase